MKDPFLFHSIVSNAPAVITTGLLPLLFAQISPDIEKLGFGYLLIRFGLVFGLFAFLKLPRNLVLSRAARNLEILNVFNVALLIWSYLHKSEIAFYVAALLKGGSAGLMWNIRFVWLKNSHSTHKGRDLNALTNIIVQSSYALVGIVLLFGNSIEVVYGVLVVDMMSSGLCAYVFSRSQAPNLADNKPSNESVLQILKSGIWRPIIISDIFLSLALGGTNILLVEFGSRQFGELGGYPTSLIGYGIFYYIGGRFLQKQLHDPSKTRRVHVCASLLLAVSLFLKDMWDWPVLSCVTFVGIFLTYPVLRTLVQDGWFSQANPQQTFEISALQIVISQSVLGAGEYLFAAIEKDGIFRGIAALMFILFFAKSRRVSNFG